MTIGYFNHSCQGESHKATGKVCQDYSLTWQDPETKATVAVVCDGHGGDSYFRSSVGAEFAAKITLEKVKTYISEVDENLFQNLSFTQVGTVETFENPTPLDMSLRRLFTSIYSDWRTAIIEDGKRPLDEWETQNVSQEDASRLSDEKRIVKVYGCTLMVYVCTQDFWFAFHLGDGKCVMFDHDNNFTQPIPWDEKCFLNKTTSMCDNEPVGEFRYCAEGDGKFPIAVFLGSDGMDDTFGDGEKLNNFYANIIKSICKDGQNSVKKSLEQDLPELSRRGSQDDMSLAVVYDKDRLYEAKATIVKFTRSIIERDINSLLQEVNKRKDIITKAEKIESEIANDTKEAEKINTKIDCDKKLVDEISAWILKLRQRIDEISREISGRNKEFNEIQNRISHNKQNLPKIQAEARMAAKELERHEKSLADKKAELSKFDNDINNQI